MKKLFTLLVAAILCVTCLFSFTACSKAEKVKVINVQLTAEDYAYVVKEGDVATKASIDAFLATIKTNGTLDNVINSFFDGTAEFTYENPASKEGCLLVATSADFPPFEYKEGNAFTGIDLQIAKLYADSIGKTLYIDDIGFDAVILSMGQATTDYDLGMAGITYSEDRDKSMDFSTSYYSSSQVVIVKESDTMFDNCKTVEDVEAILAQQNKDYKIGTQKGTTGYMYSNGDESFGYDGFTNLTTTIYDAGALAVQDLSNGKINAVIIDEQPAKMIAKSVNEKIK